MGRKILGIISGLICGGLTVALIESISSFLHPIPENFDPKNIDQMKAFIGSLPANAFMIVLLAHLLGSLVAGLVASLVIKETWTTGAILLGLFFTSAGIANLVMIPHPAWFAVIDTFLYLPAAYLGATLAGSILHSKSDSQHEITVIESD